MMWIMSEKEREAEDLVLPWLQFSEEEWFTLREDAPEEVKEAYKIFNNIRPPKEISFAM